MAETQRMGGAGCAFLILLAVIVKGILSVTGQNIAGNIVDAKAVGISLFGPYVLAVELASMLLLAGLVVAFHIGREDKRGELIAKDQDADKKITEERA